MKILMNSLGCDKNLVDAEEMLACLMDEGHTFTDDPSQADIIIINTCCFIEDAKRESIEAILEAAEWKEKGHVKAVIAAGCMAARYADEIRKELPEVDAMTGIAGAAQIADAVRFVAAENGAETDGGSICSGPAEPEYAPKTGADHDMHARRRMITTGGLFEYLRIADGCDKNCTYCVIPSIRGHYRSVPMEELVAQAKDLAEQGVRELILVAQETTLYGVDLYGEKRLHLLLRELCRIDGLRWIRILYCYPEEIYPDLIRTMAEEPKICHYIDMPIQHISDEILRRMNRRTNGEDIRRIIRELREAMPDIAIRTTLLTGFPGESEEAHEELLSFVAKTRFERLGVFTYSKEENTPASRMKNQIHPQTKKRRRRELMELQQEISDAYGSSRIGTECDVLIEGMLPDENVFIGRTYTDAPDVDGYVFVHSDRQLETGDLISAKITGATEYDLTAEEVENNEVF